MKWWMEGSAKHCSWCKGRVEWGLCAWSAGVDGRAWSFCSELLIPSQHFVTLSHLFQGVYSFPLPTASFKRSQFTWVQREIQKLCGGEIHPWLVCKRPELSQETTWSYHSWSLGRCWVRCYHKVGFSYFLSSQGTCQWPSSAPHSTHSFWRSYMQIIPLAILNLLPTVCCMACMSAFFLHPFILLNQVKPVVWIPSLFSFQVSLGYRLKLPCFQNMVKQTLSQLCWLKL